MIKYKYAYNIAGSIINIEDLDKTTLNPNEKFKCISCAETLIARLGNRRQKHFAHKLELECSQETYLHFLGKKLFYDAYSNCLENKTPFLLDFLQQDVCIYKKSELGITCKLDKSPITIDLTHYFTEIKMEHKEELFVPDILLFNPTNNVKLYFEIAVTHLVTESKKNSGFRIIQLLVKNENDLQPIQNRSISHLDSNIKLYNFKQINEIENHCSHNCVLMFEIYTVFLNGKSILSTMSLTDISDYLKRNDHKIRYYEISQHSKNSPMKYKYYVSKTYLKDDIFIKNCFICKYHTCFPGSNQSKYSIYCDKLEKFGNSNDAAFCNYFSADESYINGNISSWENDAKNY